MTSLASDSVGGAGGGWRWRLTAGLQYRPLADRNRDGALLVPAVGQLADDARLEAVLQRFHVLALQAQADPLGQPVGGDRPGEDRDPGGPGGQVQVNAEVVGDQVIGARQP